MESRVNHPSHYSKGVYEVINIIRHFKLNFSMGNVIKYTLRAGKKKSNDTDNKDIEDLKKAKWYLEEEIKYRESKLETKECPVINFYKENWVL